MREGDPAEGYRGDSHQFGERIQVETTLRENGNLKGVGSIGVNYGDIFFGGPDDAQTKRAPLAHHANLKYRADRHEQERQIFNSLSAHKSRASRQPILFIVHGQETQCVSAFAKRLVDTTLPNQLKTLVHSDQVAAKYVMWPSPGSKSSAERVLEYRENLTMQLDLASEAGPAAIAERIASYRCTVVLNSVHTEVTGEDEAATARAVIAMWKQLPELQTDLGLIIVLAFVYAEQERGLVGRLFSKERPSTLAKNIPSLTNDTPTDLLALVLPELANVTLRDTEHWIRTVLQPPDIEEALASVRDVFGGKHPRPDASLPMSVLGKHLDRIVPRTRETFRQQ